MQLKFSKKSFNSERASSLGGNGLKTVRRNRSPKISGFQCANLLSSSEVVEDIISWKDVSPVFSFTHCMPFGEKMENPDDEPKYWSILERLSARWKCLYRKTLIPRSCL